MLFIKNDSCDPYFNLALEEYILKSAISGERCLMLWQNRPAVIVGRFQNTIEEINSEYIQNNNIAVVRRLSGGGAVYHDLGNLNFTFIEKRAEEGIRFSIYTERIARALAKLGIRSEISGRNDITINGAKFSGNAQFHYRDKVLHHGTILYSANLSDVALALNVKADKIESKGIKSVRSRVVNIQDYMERKISITEFARLLKEYLLQGEEVIEYTLSEDDRKGVQRLLEEKYLTWEWNYGNSPAFNLRKYGRFPCGGLEIRIYVDQGIIRACKIYGDFFSSEDIAGFEKILTGARYEQKALDELIIADQLERYFGPLKKDELMKLLF